MKKIAFFCCALLALGFASCDDKSDLGMVQTNPQLPQVEASALKVTLLPEMAASAVSLGGIEGVPAVITDGEVANLPAGYEVAYEMELATKADYSNSTIIPVENKRVSAAAWNEYFREQIGMNNAPVTNYVRFAAYFVNGTQRVRVGGPNNWYYSRAITVYPAEFTYPTLTVKAAEGNYKIVDFGGNGTSYQGFAMLNGDYSIDVNGKVVTGNAKNAGLYFVDLSIDTEKDTRKVKVTQVKNLGAMGDFNKWAKQSNLTQNGLVFTGDVDFGETLEDKNEFKFRMSNNNSLTLGGYQTDLLPGGANMPVPGPGVWTITVDLSSIPYTYKAVSKK